MLRHLTVHNIALIRALDLDFTTGLNVLTGETGAGKSLIIDSLNFVLGAKADKTLISYGADKASVEAIFCIPERTAAAIEELGYLCDDNELLISRSMTTDGKSDIRLNGKASTLGVLRAVTELLADIHGQHEHQSLLNVAAHGRLLDDFGGKEIIDAKAPLNELCVAFRDVQRGLEEIGGSDEERARILDILSFQLDEISNANLSVDEEREIEQKYLLATNAEKLTEILTLAMQQINGQGERLSELARAGASIERLSRFDQKFSELAQRANSAYLELDDVNRELSVYLDENTVDPREIDSIIARMEEYKKLKKKYGQSVEDIFAFKEDVSKKYNALINSEEQKDELTKKKSVIINNYKTQAEKLRQIRKKYAQNLSQSVLVELTDLGMGGSTFEIRVEECPITDSLSANGADHVEFFLSTNKGEPVKPLAKVISGGEMSRFMLALKVIAAESDYIDTMVFDEIDTGISGKVGEAIACRLAKLSRKHQVLCITHLPAIAAMADSQFKIYKDTVGDKTTTHVDALNEQGMIEEISRLVGGAEVSAHSRSHSEDLKTWANHYKATL